MVSDKDRRDYEEGRKDRGKGTMDQFVTDIFGNHPDSDAYYKGRRGEKLDSNKKK